MMATLFRRPNLHAPVQFRSMRSFFALPAAVLLVYILSLSFSGTAQAADLFWDTDGTTGGFGTAGGTWAAPTPGPAVGWTTDNTGASAIGSVTTTTADILNFGTDTLGLASGTITVSGTVSANSLTFGSASGAVVLSGGTITLGGTTPTISVNNTSDTISSVLDGSAGLIKAGSGTLTLQSPSGASRVAPSGGTTINGGTLGFNLVDAGPDRDLSGSYTVNNGSSLLFYGTGSRELFNGSTFTYGSTGGGTITIDSMNPIVNGSTITTTGGAKNTFGGTSSLNAQGNNLTFNVATGADPVGLEFTGNAGNLKLIKNGAGVMTISSSANAMSAGLDINTGTLEITGSGRLNSGTYAANILNNASFGYNSSATQTLSGVISGSGALTKNNTGTLVLTGNNTYTGATTISGGTLTLSGGAAIADTGLVDIQNVAGATLQLNSSETIGGLTGGGATGGTVNLQANTLTVGDATNRTFAGTIFGSGGLTKVGAGMLDILMGTSYTGTTTINGGTLRFTNVADLTGVSTTAFNINNSSTLEFESSVGGSNRTVLNGKTFTFGSSGGGTINFNNGNHLFQGGVHNFVTTGGSKNTISRTSGGFINNQGSGNTVFNVADGSDDVDLELSAEWRNGTLTKSGAGTMAIAGVHSGDFAIDIDAGTLEIGGSSSLNGGTFTAAITNDGTFKYNSTATQTLSGLISGGGALTKNGSGTLVLSGASANTYTGTTTVNGGSLVLAKTAGLNAVGGNLTIGDGAGLDIVQLTNSNQIADTSVVTFGGSGGNAGILRLNNQNETIGGLNSSGSAGIVENESGSAATSTLTANIASGSQTFSGILRNGDGAGTDGTLAFTKTGAGTQVLSGASTYTGATNINGGTLSLTGSINTGAGTSGIQIKAAAGATLDISGSLTTTYANARAIVVGGAAGQSGTINISGSGSLTTPGMLLGEDSGGTGIFNQTGGTVAVGANELWLTGNTSTLTLSGGTFSAAGTTRIAVGATVPSTSTITVNGTGSMTLGTLSFGVSSRNYTNATVNVGDGSAGGTLQVNSISYGGGTGASLLNLNGGTLVANGTFSTPASVPVAGATFGTVVGAGGANISVLGANTLTIPTALTDGGGGGGLTKSGPGTLTISGASANTYTGTTTVNGGSLVLAKTAGLNAIGGNLTIGDGTGLDIVRLTNSSQIADTSVVTFNGTGADAGSLRLNNQSETIGGLSSTGGAGIVENESGSAAISTLTANVASGSQTFSGILRNGDGTGTDGTLAFTKTGAGTQVLSGNNTYSGTTRIDAGNLDISNNSALGTAAGGTSINGGRLRLNAVTISEPIMVDAVVAGNGGITGQSGSSVLNGAVTLNADLDVRGSNITWSGGITSSANQSVSINGANHIINTNPIDLNAGTLTITSAGNSKANATQLNVGGNDWGLARINFDGYLLLGGNNFMPADAGVEFGWSTNGQSSGTFDLGGFNQTVSYLRQTSFFPAVNGNQNVTGGGILTINAPAGTYDYHGRITDGTTPTSIVKDGVGTQILNNQSGTPSAFTGTTTVNAGILELVGGAAVPDAGAVIVDGGTLQLDGSETIGSLAGVGGTVNLQNHTLSTGGATTFAGDLVGSTASGLTKYGAGTMAITGDNSAFRGTYTVSDSGGSLSTGSLFGVGDPSRIHVGSGATFDVSNAAFGGVYDASGSNNATNTRYTGTGTINTGGNTFEWNDGVTIAPGNSPGGLTIAGPVNWFGGDYDWDLNAAPGAPGSAGADPGWDLITVTGTLDLTTAGTRVINIINATLPGGSDPAGLAGLEPGTTTVFEIIQAGLLLVPNNLGAGFHRLYNVQLAGGIPTQGFWQLWYQGNSIFLVFTTTPEPGTWVLFGLLGCAVACGVRRRRQPAV